MAMPVRFDGTCDPAFRRVADVFRALFDPERADPVEVGAAICLIVDGRTVVDLWGGVSDSRGTLWRPDTAPCVFSCTKGIAATLFHIIAAERDIDYDTPVARWWPEFAAAGKQAITIRELLSHRAGLGRLATPAVPGQLLAWDRVTAGLAASPAFGQPPRRAGYHAVTFGWLIGELMIRITGENLDVLLDYYINRPLGTAFAWRGDGVEAQRFAMLASGNPGSPVWEVDGDARLARISSLDDPDILSPAVASSKGWRAAYVLAAGGHSDARSLAAIYAALIDRKTPLIARDRLSMVTKEHARGQDALLNTDSAYALGYQLPAGGVTLGNIDAAGTSLFGHKGAYGSTGLADPDRGMAFGYVTNLCGAMGDRSRNGPLLDAALACL